MYSILPYLYYLKKLRNRKKANYYINSYTLQNFYVNHVLIVSRKQIETLKNLSPWDLKILIVALT